MINGISKSIEYLIVKKTNNTESPNPHTGETLSFINFQYSNKYVNSHMHIQCVNLQEDTTFNIGLRLQMHSQSLSDVTSHDVTQTCSYTRWSSREVLCDRNYMEVGYCDTITQHLSSATAAVYKSGVSFPFFSFF